MHSYNHLFKHEIETLTKLGEIHRSVLEQKFGPHEQSAFSSPRNDPYIRVHYVFQGGGILGIAHLGFFSGLEKAGFRAVGLAGTSAGAILALLVAAARGIDPNRGDIGETLLDVLWQMPAEAFMDGPYTSRRLTKFALARKTISSLEMSMPLLASLRRLLQAFGLHRGNTFETWLSEILSLRFQIRNCDDLAKTVRDCFSAGPFQGGPSSDQLIKLFATGLPIHDDERVANGIKFAFPRDAAALHPKDRQRSPAMFARASMSVPLFFEPYQLDLDREGWVELVHKTFRDTLHEDARRVMNSATKIAFVDGGLLSNFPIDAFSRPAQSIPEVPLGHRATGWRVTDFPTIGSTLVTSKKVKARIAQTGPSAFAHYLQTVLDGMRHVRDRDAAYLGDQINNVQTTSNTHIAPVDVDGHNWLNFQLNEEDKTDLYRRGLRAAKDFIEKSLN